MGREKKTLLDAEKTVDAVNSHCAHLRIFLVFRYLDSKYQSIKNFQNFKIRIRDWFGLRYIYQRVYNNDGFGESNPWFNNEPC